MGGAADLASLVYRRSVPADAEAFARLMAHDDVYPGLLQMPYPSAETWRPRLESAADGERSLSLVAVAPDGELAASGGIFPLRDGAARVAHVGVLGLSVAVGWQGRGLGGEMMQRLLQWADDWAGYLRLELTVFTDNERALRLYRRAGFVLEGTRRAYVLRAGSYVDSHLMARLHPRPPRLPG